MASRFGGPPASAPDAILVGVRLHEAGKHLEAARHFERILKTQPRHPLALWHMGRALTRLKQPQQAIAVLRLAVAARPKAVEPLFDLARAFLAVGRADEAVAHHRAAVELAPAVVAYWSALGFAQIKARRPAEAEVTLRHALTLDPNHAETLNHLGIALNAQNRPADALAFFEQSLEREPRSAQTWSNLGGALKSLNQLPAALKAYARAVALEPKNATIKYNEAIAQLTHGELRREVWLKYDYRWVVLHENPQRGFKQPLWRGEPLAGKSILLYAEQGLGDTLQFVRYTALLAAQGATVHVEVQPPLKTLLATVPGATSVIAKGDLLPEFDFQCPLLSLPFACDTRLETIPASVPYVQAPADRVARWAARLGGARTPRVGLVWRGNPRHGNDANRSAPFAAFNRLCARDACEFVPLQLNLTSEEAAFFDTRPHCRDFTAQLEDFGDTAALIAQLDLVVSVDTSVAHLAGALGKPVWLLLPFAPDWRWLIGRSDTPWYPGMRLFRQPAIANWNSVLDSVAAELARLTFAVAA